MSQNEESESYKSFSGKLKSTSTETLETSIAKVFSALTEKEVKCNITNIDYSKTFSVTFNLVVSQSSEH
jgi:hypothetical protein